MRTPSQLKPRPLGFLCLALVAGLVCSAGQARAQTQPYPNKPIKIGQQVLVEAKPGASTIIGADAVAKAAPDGYTLLMTTSGTLISNIIFYNKLPYAVKDFVPITQTSLGSVVFVGAGNAPYANLKEFATWAKTQNRPINFGSWGQGTSGHIFGEMLKKNYGIEMNHVPYKGDVAAFTDIRGGVLDVAFGSPTSSKPMIAQGHLKALGMTGPRRPAAMADVPMFSEQGFNGFELAGFVAVYAPAGTPKPIIEKLSAEFAKVIRQPDVTARMLEQGQEPIANTPEEAEKAYRQEFPKWEAMIKSTGVTPPQ
jgi:tripartite-type tricarboxylate transporter receptor subunit TctC